MKFIRHAEVWLLNDRLINMHSEDLCEGEVCVVHNPTLHRMIGYKLIWRDDRGIFERLCDHGIGHPDPDQFEYWAKMDRISEAVHGCDGCCGT